MTDPATEAAEAIQEANQLIAHISDLGLTIAELAAIIREKAVGPLTAERDAAQAEAHRLTQPLRPTPGNRPLQSLRALLNPPSMGGTVTISQSSLQPIYSDVEAAYSQLADVRTALTTAQAERDALRAIIEMYPHTADGVPVVPGMTLFVLPYPEAELQVVQETKPEIFTFGPAKDDGEVYIEGFDAGRQKWAGYWPQHMIFTTREAALAALAERKEPER